MMPTTAQLAILPVKVYTGSFNSFENLGSALHIDAKF
jgi:hypothetical protein